MITFKAQILFLFESILPQYTYSICNYVYSIHYTVTATSYLFNWIDLKSNCIYYLFFLSLTLSHLLRRCLWKQQIFSVFSFFLIEMCVYVCCFDFQYSEVYADHPQKPTKRPSLFFRKKKDKSKSKGQSINCDGKYSNYHWNHKP